MINVPMTAKRVNLGYVSPQLRPDKVIHRSNFFRGVVSRKGDKILKKMNGTTWKIVEAVTAIPWRTKKDK